MMNRFRTLSEIALLSLAILGSGCGQERAENDGSSPSDAEALEEEIADASLAAIDAEKVPEASTLLTLTAALGLTQYKGAISPMVLSSEGDVTTYEFNPEEGPMCMRGGPFHTAVRDRGSESLVLFLQGGGACWSAFCLAVTGAPEGVPKVDILNPELEANPTRDWNAVYVPYCDGSFFVGDAEHDDNINEKGTRFHRGLANLTGAFEVASMRFPNPKRVLLSGSSGGAYGLLMAGALLRHYYPDTELIIMADSGIGIAHDGDPAYITLPLEEFNALRLIPDDCEECIVSGHLTGLVSWFLKHDPTVRIGLYSSWYDSVLANVFLQIPPEAFADALKAQTDLIAEAYPNRFRRFITDGTQHTSLIADATGVIGTDLSKLEYPEDALSGLLSGGLIIGSLTSTEIDGFTMSEWLGALIDNDLTTWVDILEERGPSPKEEE